ncbi:hypothetical protein PROFUN_04125 [Planoprotostelium fungivorum]|uniref:Ubiquitin-like domain-containing protein n=1 Tax=Planoprotostelium fungivorum TaxID=1890364 RepID=A0A2P6NJL3_9EUKA|nr:hypothetical protein PROFUN_04125 [Planoprotostelium fungivorum]
MNTTNTNGNAALAREYKRFLQLKFKYGDYDGSKLFPSQPIEEFWKKHRTDEAKYKRDCNDFFGDTLEVGADFIRVLVCQISVHTPSIQGDISHNSPREAVAGDETTPHGGTEPSDTRYPIPPVAHLLVGHSNILWPINPFLHPLSKHSPSVTPTTTVAELKLSIQKEVAVCPIDQRLWCVAGSMEDSRTMEEYRARDYFTVWMFQRLRGC